MFKSTARSVAKLKTKNVFIDTEVIDAGNLNFDPTAFKELVRLVEAENCAFRRVRTADRFST
jgi:hypothetical protein